MTAAAPSAEQTAPPVPHAAALYLAVIQFFFATTWTVYVIFLPTLAESVGIRRELVIWILMLDQLVFAVMDSITGIAADRVGRIVGRLGPAIVALTTLSCLAFLALPHVAGLDGGPVLFFGLTVIWTATSSALRAPAWVLLGKYAATPSLPWLAALSLIGVSLGGAIAPYLGFTLRNTDPRLPFAVSSLTLLATSVGLIWVERALTHSVELKRPAPIREDTDLGPRLEPGRAAFVIGTFLTGAGVLALGYQMHVSFNVAAQYLRFVPPSDIDSYIPIFWIGFNLLALPAAYLTPRMGGFPVMAWSAGIGALGTIIAALAPNLALTIIGQLMAGGAWGALLMAGLAAALSLGRTGREGATLGVWFSSQAIAALLRMGLVAAELNKAPEFPVVAPWAPSALWIAAVVLIVALMAWARETTRVLTPSAPHL